MLKGIGCVILLLFLPFASFAGSRFYWGAFGGGGYSHYGSLSQRSIVYFNEAEGGPLFVDATGNANNKPAWMAGLHAGREWEGWSFCAGHLYGCLSPAGEVEGYYLNSRISAKLHNPTLRIPEHLFVDSFNMNSGLLFVNSLWVFRSPFLLIEPYIGGGLGAAWVSLSGANSTQLSPSEPGVNHFNSGTYDFNWAFAAQAKAGAHFNMGRNWRVFAEYRYLYLNPTNYRFGSTQYPNHAATNIWNVHLDSMRYHLGSVGIEYFCDAIC